MASIIGLSGSGTIGTDAGTVIFDATVDQAGSGGVCGYVISNDGAVNVLVQVENLHDAETFVVPAGKERTFAMARNHIKKITGHAASATCAISGGAVAKA